MYKKKQQLSFQEVLSKLMHYCGYQERSINEVKHKLSTYRLTDPQIDELIELLVQDNFLNEERFAELYVRSKVKVKRWGVYKIKEGLVSKGVSAEIISSALQEINAELYWENLNYLIEKKMDSQPDLKNETNKLYRYALSKGYEGDIISKAFKEQNLIR